MTHENSAKPASAAVRLAYAHSLAELGRLLKHTRTHRCWTVSRVAELSGLPKQRLIQYEAGSVPIPYGHALLLAHPLELHLTEMISVLSAPTNSLSSEEFRTLVLIGRNQAKPHWPAMRKEFARGAKHFEKSWQEMTFTDVTLAGWPEFLPPALEEQLADEAAVLDVLFDMVLGPIFDSVSRCNPTEQTATVRPCVLEGANIYQQFRRGFEFLEVSLHWLQQRHRTCIPEFFEQRVEVQREHLRHAMKLFAPYAAAEQPPEPVPEKQVLEDFMAVCMDVGQVQAGLNELADQIRRQR